MLASKTIRWFPQLQQIVKFSSVSSEFIENKLRVLDLDINYIETFGSSENAPPIFVLPGGFGSIEMDFLPIVRELNIQKYKWIAWDPPGFGKSRPPARTFRPKGYECGYESDVKYASELMNILGFKKYTILAWSSGSITGVRMINQHPEKVSGLITWGGWGFVGPDVISVLEEFIKYGIKAIPSSRRAQLVKMYGEDTLVKMWKSASKEIIELSETEVYKKDGMGTYQNLLKNIRCPTLVIHGLKDSFFGVSYARHLQSRIRNSRLHLIENGTHNLHLREIKEFASCIENFMDSVVINQNK